MKNYKQALRDAGKFASHVLLGAYAANLATGLANVVMKDNAYDQFLESRQGGIIAEKLISTDEIYKNIEANPTALGIVKAAHFQVQSKIDYKEDKRTLDDALSGAGNCLSYSGLTFAGFANVLEKHPEFKKFEKDVRMVQGIDNEGSGHVWLEVMHDGEFAGIETTSDYDNLKESTGGLLKEPVGKSTRYGDLLAEYSDYERTKTITLENGKVKMTPHYENIFLPRIDFVYTALNETSKNNLGKSIPNTKIPFSLYLMAGLNTLSCLNGRRKSKKNEMKNARKRQGR